ncbi:MAG: polyamine aminopropyltransferase [Hyphomonadaceae bacterium]
MSQNVNADAPAPMTSELADLGKTKLSVLLVSILIVALCGIVYELIIGTVSSYLLGNSVYQFSLTIGFFMFAMGVGSHLSRYVETRLLETFIYVEMVLALVGGLCSVSLFMLFPFAPWLYTAAMFGFIFVIGGLVGIEIPLLMRILSEHHGTRKSIADVLSLDYIGALFGSVAFPLLLLPSLGLIASSFAIGLINVFVAFLNAVWLREHLASAKRMIWMTVAIFVGLVVLTLSASRITSFAQHHLYFDQVVWEKQSPYQSLTVTNAWPNGDLRLFIDGHLQFSQQDEHRYHEALVHPALGWSGVPKRVLVLGGGDGMAVREILKHDGVETIDLVDLDPQMTWLGQSFAPVVALNQDALNAPEVTIYNEDAFVFIQRSEEKYDRVIIDFPDPHNEAISKLYSEEFYALVRAHLSDGGVVVTQSSSPYFARRTYWSIGATLESIFPDVLSYQITIPSFGVWGYHMAFANEGGALERVPEGLAAMSAPVFEAAQVFPCDISKLNSVLANSIFDPSLYEAYTQDLRTPPQKALEACRNS